MNRHILFLLVFLFGLPLMAQVTVTGNVTDEQGQPIPGANVLVKGTTKGVSTDFDGNYTLEVNVNDVLEFSSLGFSSKEVRVTSPRRGESRLTINVVLVEDATQLEDVVVTAFGTAQRKASLVGAVESVKPSELKVPSTNLSTSFAGRMAGVVAVQRSGQPGADGASFWIRGISTLSGATNPLIIVDGVQVSSYDLNALDPEVIDSFSILKDATATALYGSRGANGVMIVTTKSGANLDKPIINVRVEGNMTQPTNTHKFVDGVRYMNLFNEGVRNLSSNVVPYSQEKIDMTAAGANPYVFPNVNWFDEIFKDRAFNQRLHLNIRGGGDKLTYFMSGSLNHDTGMIKNVSKDYFSFDNNVKFLRYAFQNNIDLKISEYAKVGLKVNAQFADRRNPRTGVEGTYGKIMNINPVDFPIRYENAPGSDVVRWGAYGGGTDAAGTNPLANLVSGYNDQFESTVIANVDYEQKLDYWVKGLKFSALASFKNYSNTVHYRNAPINAYLLSSFQRLADGTYDYVVSPAGNEQTVVLNTTGGTSGDRRIYLQSIVSYDRTFDIHDVSAQLIYNQEETALNNIANDDAFTRLLNSLPRRNQGIAGRISYGYDRKYLAEFNMGYNGSENFAKGKRFGFFPSFALGYNVSEEEYFAPLKDIVTWLKVRGSWGLVGNDNTGAGRFSYMSSINLGGVGFRTGQNQDYALSGPTYNRYENPNLTWEVGEKINFGIDAQLFNDINLTFETFREIRRDIFQQRGSIPTYLGTAGTAVYGNLAEVKNWGIDASLDYSKQVNKDLFFSAKGTFTFARNKVLKFDEAPFQQYPGLSRIGTRLNTYLLYEADRLFIDDAEVAASPNQQISGNVSAGDIKYVNQPDFEGNYDNIIDANDRRYMGDPTVPEIVYGLGANVKYKEFDFGFFFQGVANTSLLMQSFHPFGTQSRRNVLEFVANDYWSPENQNIYASYPRLTHDSHGNNTASSTFWLRNGAFLKLRNVEIGYTPEKMKNMRVYFTGMNLWTISKFKHWDPEQGSNAFAYPTQTILNLGVQITFN